MPPGALSSTSLKSLAVPLLLAVAPLQLAAATLVPGGGSRRTDCMMQMSAEGVGFPTGKTPKGVSCADGDVCDLDGQRNGVCVFRERLCLNQPTRACQPHSVSRSRQAVGYLSMAIPRMLRRMRSDHRQGHHRP